MIDYNKKLLGILQQTELTEKQKMMIRKVRGSSTPLFTRKLIEFRINNAKKKAEGN